MEFGKSARAFVTVAISILLGCLLWAQSPTEDLFSTVKPDVSIVVRKQPLGADLVEVTYIRANFPPQVAEQQIDRLAQLLQTQPRGLDFKTFNVGSAGTGSMLRCTFGMLGLVNPDTGQVRIDLISKAFAGVPSPNTISGLMVVFSGFEPGPKTLKKFFAENGSVSVLGRTDDKLQGVEYRVRLGSQNPSAIVFPDNKDSEGKKEKTETKSNDYLVWGILFIASIAAGALVYSLTLQARSTNVSQGRR